MEVENDAITRSSHNQIQENLARDYRLATQKATAFRRFIRSNLVPILAHKQNMLNRSITFFNNLYLMRRQEQIQVKSTQVHHMISERRRREKLNENFQQLRSLLPPGTKKDKASVLAATTENIISLKAQVEELSKRNEILEAQLLKKKEASEFSSGSGKLVVQIINISESTSEARIVELQVIVKGKCSKLDLVIRLLEFLKMADNVSIGSVEANTRMVQSCPVTLVTLRLRIQGDEWDESAFLEAAKKVAGDMEIIG
ncbi:putative transcription factor bHLH041 [Nicotiana tomentosiformis]|uniref:putative transcription factor bHLH041 n=1 Tax=Nicotiana tomentosiformis TaxID=4098 RepID=UPI00051B0FCE|nr:putative transcription factor bHLH041 [Nicotiana tomentosiformis]